VAEIRRNREGANTFLSKNRHGYCTMNITVMPLSFSLQVRQDDLADASLVLSQYFDLVDGESGEELDTPQPTLRREGMEGQDCMRVSVHLKLRRKDYTPPCTPIGGWFFFLPSAQAICEGFECLFT
jgi:hypothetical protein